MTIYISVTILVNILPVNYVDKYCTNHLSLSIVYFIGMPAIPLILKLIEFVYSLLYIATFKYFTGTLIYHFQLLFFYLSISLKYL